MRRQGQSLGRERPDGLFDTLIPVQLDMAGELVPTGRAEKPALTLRIDHFELAHVAVRGSSNVVAREPLDGYTSRQPCVDRCGLVRGEGWSMDLL
jgi:hypothetical protein